MIYPIYSSNNRAGCVAICLLYALLLPPTLCHHADQAVSLSLRQQREKALLRPGCEAGLQALRERYKCSPLCSPQKQQAMPPLSADLWMPGLPAVVPAADISTRQGRKDPFLGRAWWVIKVSAGPWPKRGELRPVCKGETEAESG